MLTHWPMMQKVRYRNIINSLNNKIKKML